MAESPRSTTSPDAAGITPSVAASTPSATETRVRIGLVIVLQMLPLIALIFTPFKHEAYLYFLATMPARFALSLRLYVALLAVVLTALVVPVAIVSSDSAMSATLLMILTGVVVGLGSLRGWHGPLMYVGAMAGLLVTTARPHADLGSWATPTVQLWLPGLLALAGGLWSVLLTRTLMKHVPEKPPARVGGSDAFAFGLALCILLGVATAVAMTWFFDAHAGWILLTILLVVKPDYSTTTKRVWTRCYGTVVGGSVAALLAIAVDDPAILQLAGALFAFVMLWVAYTHKPYFVISAVITPTIVLLTSSGERPSIFDTDLERVFYTLLAAVLILVVVGTGQLVTAAIARRHDLPVAPIATA